jgi:hypothetical protein
MSHSEQCLGEARRPHSEAIVARRVHREVAAVGRLPEIRSGSDAEQSSAPSSTRRPELSCTWQGCLAFRHEASTREDRDLGKRWRRTCT